MISMPNTHKLKLDRPLVCFDLETTGIDTATARIVEIGIQVCHTDGRVADPYSRRINPVVPLPEAATAIHGITQADVDDLPTFKQIAVSLWGRVNGCDLAGYNIRGYDVPLLAAEFRRIDWQWPPSDVRLVDGLAIFRAKEPQTKPKKLANAVRFYTGEELTNAHTAGADTAASMAVILAQAERYGALDIDGLVNLTHNPNYLDAGGKIMWRGESAVLTFGKHANKPLSSVPRSYIAWMLTQTFPDDVISILRQPAMWVRQKVATK